MRGVDVSPWTAPLDDLFLAGPWIRLAVGDGGNEIGMGKLPPGLIARTVPNGEKIACVTSCDQLVVAGVSNWGAYGLMAALAVAAPRLGGKDRDVPDGGTRPRGDAGDRRQGGRRRWRDGAARGDGRRLRARDPWAADRRARSHCTGAGGGLGSRAMENPYAPTHPEIRDAVRQLCLKFDGAYWRELDRERGYPTEFVQGADRGRLARDPDPGGIWRLGARHLGGGGGARGSPARRLQWRRLPRPDVHHGHACCGTAARSRRNATCPRSPAASCACRRSASPSRPAAPIRWRCARRR